MKTLYSLLVIGLFCIGFAASDKDKTNISSSVVEYIGTYTITDENNVSYTININKDNTATMEAKGNVFYGTWHDNSGLVAFEFTSDNNDYPNIKVKYGDVPIFCTCFMISDDGFLYVEADTWGSPSKHNPEYRLKYQKVK